MLQKKKRWKQQFPIFGKPNDLSLHTKRSIGNSVERASYFFGINWITQTNNQVSGAIDGEGSSYQTRMSRNNDATPDAAYNIYKSNGESWKMKTSVESLAIFVKAMLSSIVLSLALYTKAYIPNVYMHLP